MAGLQESVKEQPPGIMAAFIAGFNTVAGHLYLILLPLGVDLILWFAPRLRIEQLLTPYFQTATTLMERSGTPTTPVPLSELWQPLLKGINLLGLLKTFPIGVPSLLTGFSDATHPLGTAPNVQISSMGALLGVSIGLMVVGFTLGCIYFALLASATAEDNRINWQLFFTRQMPSALLFCVLFYLILALMSVPSLFILGFVLWLLPGAGNIAFFVVTILIFMVLFPLIFTPHGIFALNLKPIQAALKSMVLVHPFLPRLPLFVLVALTLGQGLDLLWRSAPPDSWLTLVGILGHAFIYSAILAASFIYYRGGIQWMEFLVQRTTAKMTAESK
jgi:hypothetical protein